MKFPSLSVVVSTLLNFMTLGCVSQELTETERATESRSPSIDEWLLFYPSPFPAGDWHPEQLQFQDVFFTAQDGTRLHGWYCPVDEPRAVILVAHGNAGNIAMRAAWLRYLQSKARVSVFMFDYRGYGRSEGKPSVAGVLLDAVAARAKLRELAGIQDSEMLLMGESLGGAIVVELAARSAPRGMILQSTFSSLRDVAEVHFAKLAWIVPRTKLNSETRITQVQAPLLQSHGTADQTVPFSLGEKLFEAANEPREFFAIEGADHNDALTDEYLRKLDEFIASVASNRK